VSLSIYAEKTATMLEEVAGKKIRFPEKEKENP